MGDSSPWDLLQPQDATSRHRGAKPCRRYGLLGKISLLSPRYLLSVERRPFHNVPPDHYSPDFRPCSSCRSHSQAPLCTYTRHLIANQLREPWAPPLLFTEATAPVKLPVGTVPDPDYGPKLGDRYSQSGISTMTPPELASGLHSLPPILHKLHRTPIPNYSKGLGVFPSCCVTSIFTRSAISPSSWLRQRGSRYSIRAGRNLPDKEFRYLRMVIVTTAVYWGLNSQLRSRRANRSS